MPRKPRSRLCDPRKVAVHHLWTRTVRRCFLFGRDPLTGKDFSHREGWITERLQHLAQFFGIDVFAFAAMSNHCHLVIRTRPDRVARWSDREVACRWLRMLSRRKRNPEPTEQEIRAVLGKRGEVAKLRLRLSDPSWLMRMLCQHIAIRCNREDECSGRVFQDRFQQASLESEADVLACMAYVDLNPLRAGAGATLEDYRDVSIGLRLRGLGLGGGERPDPSAWLHPLEGQPSQAAEPARRLTADQRQSRRDELNESLGCIGMSLEDYRELLGRLAELKRPPAERPPAERPEPPEPRDLQTATVFTAGGRRLDLGQLHEQLEALSARYVVQRPKHEREFLASRASGDGTPPEPAAATAAV